MLAVATWVVTMFVSVRQHDILARGFDARAHNLLVATNWLRTASGRDSPVGHRRDDEDARMTFGQDSLGAPQRPSHARLVTS